MLTVIDALRTQNYYYVMAQYEESHIYLKKKAALSLLIR